MKCRPVCFSWLISLISLSLCVEFSDASMVNKLACICSPRNHSLAVDSRCSISCDCSPGSNGWTCICGNDKETAGNLNSSCFTSCDCISGQADSSKIWIFSKSTVIILLLFGLIMTLAFIASVAWYTYQRKKNLPRGPFLSSEKDLSINSATKLISHRASPVHEYKVYIDAPNKPIAGCIHRTSFLFRRKGDKIPGTLRRFSYSELEDATEKFSNSNLIGIGGSSHVYRGDLRCGKVVAVKRLNIWGGDEDIFLTEIELLSRLHHFNVVPLLGYCSENHGKHVNRLLVFEYMPNGNLRDFLDGASGKFLDWSSRVAIAVGAAKGLEYLHESAAPKILHSDVKSTNVLLDVKLRAKITDLGMAKHLKADDLPSYPSSPVRMQGTFGYFAPEYAIIGRGSLKSDVFSFGVVLLELITGRQPISRSATTNGEESLVIWASPRLLDSRRVMMELPDPQLNGDFPEEEMQIMAYLAKECLLLDPDLRPSMSEAVQILSTIAPEKSRRQNFSINLFQNSFESIKGDVGVADKHAENVELEEVISSELFPGKCSLPRHIDQTLYVESVKNETNTFSEDTGRLILLPTKARDQHSHEDEVVDISEPRFEAFCVDYVRSSV